LVLVSLWLLTWLLVRLLAGLLARFRILPLALLLFALLLLALLLRRVLVVLLVHDRASSPRSQADRRAGGRCRSGRGEPDRRAQIRPFRRQAASAPMCSRSDAASGNSSVGLAALLKREVNSALVVLAHEVRFRFFML